MGAILTKRNISFVVVLAAVAALIALLVFGLMRGGGGTLGALSVPKRPAPEFSLDLFDVSGGGTFSKSDLIGHPAVVNFWASWCPPCKEEAPYLEQVWQEYKDRGVVFLGIDVQDNDDDAKDFIDRYGITYRNGPDRSNIALDFGMLAVPETFFIDREGNIVGKFAGGINSEQLRTFIEELLQ
jgi:cytochrome c biogenesis protein CcmG/thiol:disulfide interchange protein DsbE